MLVLSKKVRIFTIPLIGKCNMSEVEAESGGILVIPTT